MPIPVSDKGHGNSNRPEIPFHTYCGANVNKRFRGGAESAAAGRMATNTETRVWHEPGDLNMCTPYDSALPLPAAGPGGLKQMPQEDWCKES